MRALTCILLLAGAAFAQEEETAKDEIFAKKIRPFFASHCINCHGEREAENDFRIDTIKPPKEQKADVERWDLIQEMLSTDAMPPSDEPQPDEEDKAKVLEWIEEQLAAMDRGPTEHDKSFPKFANRVDHDALFSGEHTGPGFTTPRVWRISPHIYEQLLGDLELRMDSSSPLHAMDGEGFADYALLYADEAAIRTMLQNGKRVATGLVHGRLVKPRGAAARKKGSKASRRPTRHKPFVRFAKLEGKPSADDMAAVVDYAFERLLHRQPTDAERKRYVEESLAPNVAAGGPDSGLRGFLVTLLLSPEFLFRMEIGLGKKLEDGRRMLSPHEMAYALSFALHDHPIPWLLEAARSGKLETRAAIAAAARRLVESQKLYRGRIPVSRRKADLWPVGKLGTSEVAKPRMLRFFREFFDYAKAVDVFKDDFRHGKTHEPRRIVQDADWLVLDTLHADKAVFETLLTTSKFVVQHRIRKKKKKNAKKKNKKRQPNVGYARVYNVQTPTEDRTVELPKEQRAGILTHPAWLVAHSGNFDNDPVRRGKWILEHLLGQSVPDIPIGVEAQLPDRPDQTLRQRFAVVRAKECWRCHDRMNPLGEPFEMFDDFGRFRKRHHVTTDGNVLASDLELNRNRRQLRAEPKHPVVTTGYLRGTGDEKLDGEVKDAIDLVHRLAKSTRVRQMFLRHMFRYWMGRNETLRDSPTLMAMDKTYLASGGSFRETLITLLSSDPFLYRKDP